MELTKSQTAILSVVLTLFYDELCKTGTTPEMKERIMELSKLIQDEAVRVK